MVEKAEEIDRKADICIVDRERERKRVKSAK
jgi:hypothetical protein